MLGDHHALCSPEGGKHLQSPASGCKCPKNCVITELSAYVHSCDSAFSPLQHTEVKIHTVCSSVAVLLNTEGSAAEVLILTNELL